MVDLSPVKKFSKFASLTEIRQHANLQSMLLLRKGQRLSIQPVMEFEFAEIESTWG